MSNWKSDTIRVNGVKLYYTRTGGDKPPFVLAHGFSDDGLCWTPIAQQLEKQYDVIMVDARGHGRSEGPEEGYGTTIMANDLAGVITGLRLSKPIVMGHSMGGATTLMLAATYPDLPDKIVIEDAGMFNPPKPDPNNPNAGRNRMGGWIVEIKRKTREEMIAGCRINSPTWPEAELGPWADSKLRFSFHAMSRPMSYVDWESELPKIKCPALLLTADTALGAIVTADGAATMQRLIPQLQVVNIPGAGHNIRREQPEKFMETVLGFVGK
ncbi:MAG: alpha/beta hydrolase [Caldilineaceae bacterium]